MADAYGASDAFFTVNGTTIGIQVMLHCACNPGDKVLLPRNIHKSATNALIMGGFEPVYMQAEVSKEFGFVTGVTFDTVKKQFRKILMQRLYLLSTQPTMVFVPS